MVFMALRSRVFAAPAVRAGARSLHTSRIVRAQEVPNSAAQSATYPQEGGVVLYRLGGTKKGEEETSALTQFIESLTTPSEETAANNQRHLDWTIKKAESQLLLQDAQKPPAHRIMNLTMVDISDMKLNPERV